MEAYGVVVDFSTLEDFVILAIFTALLKVFMFKMKRGLNGVPS